MQRNAEGPGHPAPPQQERRRWVHLATLGAAWIAAGAGLLAAIFTYVQIGDERDARKALEADAREQELREQAERVAAWPASDGEGPTRIVLSNSSDEPVYQAVISLVMVQGSGPQTGHDVQELGLANYQRTFALIPPGRHETTLARGWAGMGRRPGVELAFTDRGGAHWLRPSSGTLREIGAPAAAYYQLAEPLAWELP